MDDLASSIKDGRFHEQKFRLSDCGLANKIYLIENRASNAHLGLPLQNLLQAATNTQVHSKFAIKFTDSINDSMFYLSVMTSLLIKMFKVMAYSVHSAITVYLKIVNVFGRKRTWASHREKNWINCRKITTTKSMRWVRYSWWLSAISPRIQRKWRISRFVIYSCVNWFNWKRCPLIRLWPSPKSTQLRGISF